MRLRGPMRLRRRPVRSAGTRWRRPGELRLVGTRLASGGAEPAASSVPNRGLGGNRTHSRVSPKTPPLAAMGSCGSRPRYGGKPQDPHGDPARRTRHPRRRPPAHADDAVSGPTPSRTLRTAPPRRACADGGPGRGRAHSCREAGRRGRTLHLRMRLPAHGSGRSPAGPQAAPPMCRWDPDTRAPLLDSGTLVVRRVRKARGLHRRQPGCRT